MARPKAVSLVRAVVKLQATAQSALSTLSLLAATLSLTAGRKICLSIGAHVGTAGRHAVAERLAARPTNYATPVSVVRALKVIESENAVAGQNGATSQESRAGSVGYLGASRRPAICLVVAALRRNAVGAVTAVTLAIPAPSGPAAARLPIAFLALVCRTTRPIRH